LIVCFLILPPFIGRNWPGPNLFYSSKRASLYFRRVDESLLEKCQKNQRGKMKRLADQPAFVVSVAVSVADDVIASISS
jgi:hypothetical protein